MTGLHDLIARLGDPDVATREAAAEALGSIGLEAVPAILAAVPDLVAALGDEGWRARNAASDTLGKIGTVAEPALIAALESENLNVRTAAVWALRKIGPAVSGAVPALVTALRDKDERVRSAAAFALGAIGPAAAEAVPALLAAMRGEGLDPWIRGDYARALARIGPVGVALLTVALGDEIADVRLYAAYALGEVGPAAFDAVPALVDALSDASGDVRLAAAYVLGQIGPAPVNVVPSLIPFLTDEDVNARIAAARSLTHFGPEAEAAVPALIGMVGVEDPDERRFAAWALGNIGSEAAAAVPALTESLRDERGVSLDSPDFEDPRLAAVEALEKIGPAAGDAVPTLLDTLLSKDQNLYLSTIRALGKIGPSARAAVPALIDALFAADTNSFIYEEAITALRRIGPATEDELSDLLRILNRAYNSKNRLLPVLIGLLGNPSPSVRSIAAQLLGQLGPAAADAIPALIGALYDEEWELANVAEGHVLRDSVIEALRSIGPAAAPALKTALRDDNPDLRRAASHALTLMGMV